MLKAAERMDHQNVLRTHHAVSLHWPRGFGVPDRLSGWCPSAAECSEKGGVTRQAELTSAEW